MHLGVDSNRLKTQIKEPPQSLLPTAGIILIDGPLLSRCVKGRTSNARIYQNHFDTYSAQHDVTCHGALADPSLRNLHTPISQWWRFWFLSFFERGFAYSRLFQLVTTASH